jgi:CBS domain-containing protein
VRGDVGWLNRDVRCPHCDTEFTFTRPDGKPVEVVAIDGSKLKATESVSDTSVMKILGDFAEAKEQDDGTRRHCIECGATYPGYVERCYNCDVPLSLPAEGTGPRSVLKASKESSPSSIDFQPVKALPFDDVSARKVMRPRKEIQFLDVDAPLSELIQQARETRHTRYVVCKGSLDDVRGLIHIEDIVLADEDSFDIKKIIRPIERVLESALVSETLLRLQKVGEPIGLIIDEFDTVIGMVSVKDVMLKLLKK